MLAMSFNLAFSQEENKSSTTC